MIIEAASYKEFHQRYEKGRPFAIISAWQGGLSFSSNLSATKVLRQKISDQGYEQIRIIGRYLESDEDTESMIVFGEPGKDDDFLRFLIFFAKKYRQNQVTFVDSKSLIWHYATRSDSTIGAIGSKIRVDKFQPFDISNLITAYSKRTFDVEMVRVIND